MKQFNTFLLLLLAAVGMQLQAQDVRYVDEVFPSVSITSGETYGQNISILTGAPSLIDLKMDVYQPAGDAETTRPVVIYLHTGSFLPQYFNGGITGGRLDSAVVNACKRLARRGYVAIAADYRQGWLPTATDQDQRTGTLLQAAYRGIQDFRTLVRFLRKDVTEGDNQYGVDTSRIVGWGQGTGGYISLGAAYLDRYEEVVLDKFLDADTNEPYVIEGLHGDVYGLVQTPLNNPNHVGYSSDFAMAVNMGGALGDLSWIDGGGNEPPTVGYHVLRDPFAPFANGSVIVPTTMQFVVNVDGTRTVVGKANETGVNDILDPANALTLPAPFAPLSTIVNQRVEAYKMVPVPSLNTTLAVDNMYPFVTAGLQAGPWDWWSKPTLDAVIPAVNAAFGTNFNADTLHFNGLLTNPDMSAAKGMAYLDTIFAHFIPRACQGLQLASCALVLNTDDFIEANVVSLKVGPNPASEVMNISTENDAPFSQLQLFDITGRAVRNYENLRDTHFQLDRNGLPAGMYYLKLRFEKGVVLTTVQFL